MADPVITLDLIPIFTGVIDLTALTGGHGDLSGYTGADYNVRQVNWDEVVPEIEDNKLNGGNQLVETLFGSAPIKSNIAWGGSRFASMEDREIGDFLWQPATESASRRYDYGASTSCGVQYTPPSDQKLREFYWYGQVHGGGYSASCAFADGSFATQTLSLPEGLAAFKCTYRGWLPDLMAQIRITKTGSATGWIHPYCKYMPVPVAPRRPRLFRIGFVR